MEGLLVTDVAPNEQRSWQDRGSPYLGNPYGPLTPHQHWDGCYHEWTGVDVEGVPIFDCERKMNRGKKLDQAECKAIKETIIKAGIFYRDVAEFMDVGLDKFTHWLNRNSQLTADETRILRGYIARLQKGLGNEQRQHAANSFHTRC